MVKNTSNLTNKKESVCTEIAISVKKVSKKFRLFNSAKERLAEALHPLRKRFHKEFWALNDISFEVRRGEIIGILGRNGSGKSTLLQIICGVMKATHGNIEVKGRISALLELGAGFNPEFTGRENVILNGAIHGISRQEMILRMNEIEAFADIGEFFDQPVKLYSSGMFVRVAFAAAIHVDPEILVVDEALSVGDSKFQHRCFQRIRSFMEAGKTIIVVSHSTDTLLRICGRGVVLDRGAIIFIGEIDRAVNIYQELLFGAFKNNSNTDNQLLELENQLKLPKKIDLAFDAALENKINYNPHETRMGNGKVQIIDFDIYSDDELNPSEIKTHSKCELILRLICKESALVSVGFGVVSTDGTYIFGTNFHMMSYPLLPMQPGELSLVKFSWKSHIAGGEYFLNLGCHEPLGESDSFVDVRRSVAHIKFSDTPGSKGFVDLEVIPEVIKVTTSSVMES